MKNLMDIITIMIIIGIIMALANLFFHVSMQSLMFTMILYLVAKTVIKDD
jgi:hypothetical protein